MKQRVPNNLIRLLAILEASTVTGPAKNLIQFCKLSRVVEAEPCVDTSVAIYVRGVEGSSPQPRDLLQALSRNGIQTHCIPERFAFDWRVMHKLRSMIEELRPSIIQTHGVKSHFLVRLSGLWKPQPWVAFHHGYTSENYKMLAYNQLDRWSLKAPTRVVTVSEAFKRQLCSRGVAASRITVIHNAIDPDWLNSSNQEQAAAEMPRHPEISRRERIVLAIGRLSKEKAFADLLPALRRLLNLRPELPIRLFIVGDGPERRSIEQAVHQFQLGEQVVLTGHVNDIRPYYRAADMIAIPSLSEGSPNVLLEAVAAGIPVAATSVGGIPEIVQDRETAILVSPGDPIAMADAMALLLTDTEFARNLAARARSLVAGEYSPLSRTRALLNLYQEVCQERGSASTVPAKPS